MTANTANVAYAAYAVHFKEIIAKMPNTLTVKEVDELCKNAKKDIKAKINKEKKDKKIQDELFGYVLKPGEYFVTVTKNRKSINDPIVESEPKNNPLELKEFAKISLNRHSLLFVDKAPNKQVMLGNVNRKETEFCEICCVVKKSPQMMPCYNCLYPCCCECFLKRACLTLKKGNLDGRCFGCRAELVVAKKMKGRCLQI